MQITIILNGTRVSAEAAPDTLLIDFVRSHGCYSVKRGCETANCGLCTVFLDDVPVRTAAMVRPRACLRWNLLSTSWLPGSTWTPSRSVK